jgi:hypothetical protein
LGNRVSCSIDPPHFSQLGSGFGAPLGGTSSGKIRSRSGKRPSVLAPTDAFLPSSASGTAPTRRNTWDKAGSHALVSARGAKFMTTSRMPCCAHRMIVLATVLTAGSSFITTVSAHTRGRATCSRSQPGRRPLQKSGDPAVQGGLEGRRIEKLRQRPAQK